MGKPAATSRTRWFGALTGIGLRVLVVRASIWAQQTPEVRSGLPTRPAVIDPAAKLRTPPMRRRLGCDLARKAQESS